MNSVFTHCNCVNFVALEFEYRETEVVSNLWLLHSPKQSNSLTQTQKPSILTPKKTWLYFSNNILFCQKVWHVSPLTRFAILASKYTRMCLNSTMTFLNWCEGFWCIGTPCYLMGRPHKDHTFLYLFEGPYLSHTFTLQHHSNFIM